MGFGFVKAQAVLKLFIRFEPAHAALSKQYIRHEHNDSLSVQSEINKILLNCYEASFLTASVKSADKRNDSVFVVIGLGNSYKTAQLTQGNVPTEWFTNTGFRLNQIKGQTFSPAVLFKNMQALLIFAQNNGYPFASISLDSVIIDTSSLMACLKLEKNTLIFFDTLDFGGTVQIKKRFLQNYANITPGSLYNESLLINLDARLSELPFLQVTRPMGVYFYGNKARPVVYLSNRKASSFDGIIGFAPNSSRNNKLMVTGEVNLKLQNLLGSGKSLELNFRSFLNQSQDLQLKVLWPYFMNTRMGIDYVFRLLKFDTTYLDVFNDIGLQYRFTGNNYLKVFYQVQRVSLFQVDTNSILVNKSLPAFNDVRNDLYGFGIRKSKLDYFLNPSKGYLIEMDAGVGTKRIIRNAAIDALQIPSGSEFYKLYDSVKLVTMQYRASFNFSKFFKLPGNFVLLGQGRGALVYAQNLFLNELFRIGGLKTLKGFDEQSIFANKYGIVNVELRYLFQQNSSFILFWNGAWLQNTVRKPAIEDKPWGAGAGMNIETGAGIFSLYYAVGKQMDNPIEIRNAKIHFGFINYF